MLQTVHALIIEKRLEGPDPVDDIAREELMAWLETARIEGVELVVVSLPDALELYAIAAERTRAFRIVLRSLRERLQTLREYREWRTAELIGGAAVHRLLSRAAGVLSSKGRFDAAAVIYSAATLSSEVGTLGSRLAPLFWAAANVRHRVGCETTFDPRDAGESAQVERMAAERIVEEEFASFRSRQAELGLVKTRSSRPPGFNSRSFELHERASLLRVRFTRRPRPARLA